MARNYRHIHDYEEEILRLKEEGKAKREIGELLGFSKEQIQGFITRYIRALLAGNKSDVHPAIIRDEPFYSSAFRGEPHYAAENILRFFTKKHEKALDKLAQANYNGYWLVGANHVFQLMG